MRSLLLFTLLSASPPDLEPLPVVVPGLAASEVSRRFPKLHAYEPIDGPPEPDLLVGSIRIDLDGVAFHKLTVSLDGSSVRSADLSYDLWRPALDGGRGRRPDRALFDIVQRHLASRLGQPSHQGKCLRVWRTESFLVVHEIGRVKYQQKQEWDSLVASKYVDPFCWDQ